MELKLFSDKKRIYLTVLVLALILVSGIIYILYANRSVAKLKEDLLKTLVVHINTTVASGMETKINSVTMLADTYSLIKDRSELSQTVKAGEFRRIAYIETDGNGITNFDEPVSVSEKEFFLKALAGEVNISAPFTSRFDGELVTVIAAPVFEDGAVSAVVCASMDAGQLFSVFRMEDVSDIISDARMYITDREFSCLFSSGGLILGGTVSPETEEALIFEKLQSADNTGEAEFAEYTLKSKTMFLASVPIPDTEFVFVAVTPEDSVFNEVDGILRVNNIVIIAILLVFAVFVHSLISLSNRIKMEMNKTDLAVSTANLLIVKTNLNNKIIEVNDKFLMSLGYEKNELMDTDLNSLFLFDGNFTESFLSQPSFDGILCKKGGGVLYILFNVDKAANAIEYYGSDISELKESQMKIQKLAYYDVLTSLPNKISLEDEVRAIVKAHDSRFAFLFIDLDNFKYINDAFGHTFGDKTILELVRRIEEFNQTFVKNDVSLYRVGGDEFIALYRNCIESSQAGDYANMVINTISKPYTYEDSSFSITASVGISFYPENAADFDDIYKTAEIAMNNAKELGKFRASYFNTKMKSELENMVYMLNDMKEAISNKEFILYYQPQYDIQNGELCGFEALMRWNSPTRGFIPPVEFIPYAEKSRLITQMGKTALADACDFVNEMNKMGYYNVNVGVNVSAIQILDEDFVEDFLSIIHTKGINTNNIHLELTESILMESIEVNLIKIRQLNEAGLAFSLDDFGTGYSSLTYLKKLPFEYLKIDKSFVDAVMQDDPNGKDTREILKAIIALAHNIKLQVVAEGVEEYEQLEWLRERGCNICQGYFTGKPISKKDAFLHLGKNIYDRI